MSSNQNIPDLNALDARNDAESGPDSDNPPSNDNAARLALADTTALVEHADFVRCVRATLASFRVRTREMADAIADVQVETLAYARTRRMPADLRGWKALGVTVARAPPRLASPTSGPYPERECLENQNAPSRTVQDPYVATR